MLKWQMAVLRDLEDEANPSSSINATDTDVEEAGNETFLLNENERVMTTLLTWKKFERTLY